MDQLLYMLPEAKAKTLGGKLGVVKVGAQSDPPANTLEEEGAERIGDRLVNVEAERLVELLFVSIKESQVETFGHSYRYKARLSNRRTG